MEGSPGEAVGGGMVGGPHGSSGLRTAGARLVALLEEFRRRQRMRPDLVVRPWWSPGGEGAPDRMGFVVEYCPDGRSSVELAVRVGRVTVDGPGGALEAALDLSAGWVFDGAETGSPETLANHLIRLADRALGQAA